MVYTFLINVRIFKNTIDWKIIPILQHFRTYRMQRWKFFFIYFNFFDANPFPMSLEFDFILKVFLQETLFTIQKN